MATDETAQEFQASINFILQLEAEGDIEVARRELFALMFYGLECWSDGRDPTNAPILLEFLDSRRRFPSAT